MLKFTKTDGKTVYVAQIVAVEETATGVRIDVPGNNVYDVQGDIETIAKQVDDDTPQRFAEVIKEVKKSLEANFGPIFGGGPAPVTDAPTGTVGKRLTPDGRVVRIRRRKAPKPPTTPPTQ